MRWGAHVVWGDVTKAIAILLVVVYHAAVLGVPAKLVDPTWVAVNEALAAFRMPVFFFAAGLFAQSVLLRPWRRVWSTRLALLVWCFLLWTMLRFTYFLAVPMPSRPRETDLLALLLAPILPKTGLWFLHALVVFVVVAKLIRRAPLWAQLAPAALLSVLFFSVLSTGNLSYTGMGRYLVFFLAGLHLRDLALRVNGRARPVWAIAAIAVFTSVSVVIGQADLRGVPGVMTAMGFVAVVAGCLSARVLAATALARPLSYIGRNTLPIYVQHVILIAVAYAALGPVVAEGVPSWLAVALPLVVSAAVISVALLVAATVRRVPVLQNLFVVPRWFSRTPPPRPRDDAAPTAAPGAPGLHPVP